MKKFGLYLLVFITPLLNSCFECLEPSVKSEVHFDNFEALGITHVSLSKFGDRISEGTMSISSLKSGGLEQPQKLSGVEMMKIYNNSHNEWPFLLWLNKNDEIVAIWDLNDTTQRWANDANWNIDSIVCDICGGNKDQMRYVNHYTFAAADTL